MRPPRESGAVRIAFGVLVGLGAALAACGIVRADVEPGPRDGAAPVTLPSALDSSVAAPDAAASSAVAAFLSHKAVLHVGDSTVGYTLGLQLELSRMFKAAGIRYESHTVTAAGLHSFATGRILEKALEGKTFDLVIIQVGTNNLTVPRPDLYVPDLRSIVQQAGGRDCYWIGPISIDRPEKGMRAVVRDNTGPCTFYDSFALKLARQPDDVHPTQAAAKKWADAFWAFATKTPPGR